MSAKHVPASNDEVVEVDSLPAEVSAFLAYAAKAVAGFLAPFVLIFVAAVADLLPVVPDGLVEAIDLEWVTATVLAVLTSSAVWVRRNGPRVVRKR